jgi:hypothetical protein
MWDASASPLGSPCTPSEYLEGYKSSTLFVVLYAPAKDTR